LRVVCAWCQTEIRQDLVVEDTKGRVSHGICPECRAAVERDLASEPDIDYSRDIMEWRRITFTLLPSVESTKMQKEPKFPKCNR
jgi:hypothetical protein